mgnify:FL=1
MGSLQGLFSRAENELGYIEKASNSNLDSKTGNKGVNNYTKYARDISNHGLMGCQAQPWCATFQFWLECQEFGLDTALSHWNMSRSSYWGYNVFGTRNRFPAGKRSRTPQLGALVIFKQSHMGRVVAIRGNVITTIEGNTSPKSYDRNGGQVKKKSYNINDSKIDCFCIIDYGAGSNSSPAPALGWKAKGTATCTGNNVNVRMVPDGTIMFALGKGNRFEVDGSTNGDWVHIKALNTVGYMHKNYVKYDRSKPDAPAKPALQSKPEAVKQTIKENGQWGRDTTKLAQKHWGLPQDGIISNQLSVYKPICAGIIASIEWSNTKHGGSQLVRAMQHWLGLPEDGYIGPEFIKGLQHKFGLPEDGVLSNPSRCISAFQRWLNQQSL